MSTATLEIPESQRPYAARGAARQLWSCRDEEILIEGPAGTGKTRAILEKLHFICQKYSGVRVLILRKTRESMTESVLVTFEEKVVAEGDPVLNGPMRDTRRSYRYPNGSVLVIDGLTSGGVDRRAKLMSTEYDVIATFESTELSEDDWEKLVTRLRNGRMPYQQIIADCNPDRPSHWLNQRANAGKMTRLLSRHEDNPLFYNGRTWTEQGQAYIRKLTNALTGARALRLLKGKWAASEGLVYEGYDAKVHLIDRFPIPDYWRRIRVVDFGYTNPFVCQWWAIDGDGRMFRYREIYKTRTLVEDHARQILSLSEGESIEATISDHDAEDRATLERHGIPTVAAHKAITPGIEAVAARLRPAGDDRPRLFFLRDSLVETDLTLEEAKLPTCTEQEIDGYAYPKGKEGKEIKEDPVKLNDHGMDTTRYAVAYEDGLGSIKLDFSGGVIAVG